MDQKIQNDNFWGGNIKDSRRNSEQNRLFFASWRPFFEGFAEIWDFGDLGDLGVRVRLCAQARKFWGLPIFFFGQKMDVQIFR